MSGRISLKSWVCCLLLAALLLALPSSSAAQVLYGSMVGNVKDPSAAAVPGASVTIVHKETNQTRQTTTNEVGGYTFSTIPSGTYDIKVTKEGFRTFSRTNVEVTINTMVRVDITLEIGALTETVTVTGEVPLLQSDRSEVRAELGRTAMENLPVPIGRNYQQLFILLPGFRPPSNAHSIPSNPSRALLFNVNGTSASANNVRIDGASSHNIWLPHITGYVPTLESIETVNIVTNSFDAEQGLAGGAAINVQMRSGTNTMHGSLFEYHNNNRTKAREFFLPAGQNKPKWVYNQFGGTVGGPIKRDKLFYFVSYESQFDRRFADGRFSVPTAQMRAGDLSASPTPIFDPTTGNLDGSGRTRFTGNRIPEGRIDPIARKMLSFVPLPTSPERLVDNYYGALPFLFDRYTVDAKADFNATNKLRMWGRYGFQRFSMLSKQAFVDHGPELAGGNPGKGFGDTFTYTIAASYVLSPRLIVDGHFGYLKNGQNVEQPRLDEKTGLDVLGIPGTNGPRRFEGGWPRFQIEGFTTLGMPNAFMPYYRDDPQFQYVANAGWTKGTHNIRFGMDLYKQNLNHTQPEHYTETQPASGGFNFTRGVTSAPGQAQSDYNSFAAFLLGQPFNVGRILQVPDVYTTRTWSLSFYSRDQWQATRKLTLTYGLRYEYFPIPTRGDTGLERYDFDNNKMLVCGVGQIPRNCGVEISKTQFAPRFGIAYRATNTWVIRAGYGITNDPFNIARSLRTNYPVLSPFIIRGANSFLPVRALKDGIPAITVPPIGNGIVDIGGGIGLNTLGKKLARGYIQSWNLTLQKQLKWGFVGQAGYVATRQINQLGLLETNYGRPGGGAASQPLNQRFRRTANTQLVTPVANSHYDSLQATLERRFSGGYAVNVAYTWSKVIGIHNVQQSTDDPAIKIPEFYRLNRTVLAYDRTHNLQMFGIAELPFGPGKRWLNTGVASALARGWQINALLSAFSGLPFTVSASGTSLNAPFNSQRADQIAPSVPKLGGVGPGQPFYDLASAFRPVTEARFGTAGFNALRGPGAVNLDLGIFRNFSIAERWKLQFRFEGINFTNTPHFANPRGDRSARAPGEILGVSGGGIGREFGDARIFRFALRMSF